MVKKVDDTSSREPTQLDKFKETAKQVETDDSEAAFDRSLKKVAKANGPPSAPAKAPARRNKSR